MIVSVGIDIVEVSRIRDAVGRTPAFAERVFTASERAYCEAKGKAAAQSYAARFAAKEAFFKALRTGWRGKLKWTEAEIVVDEQGAPSLKLTGEADKRLGEVGADRVHLSISHTNLLAFAEVVLESSIS